MKERDCANCKHHTEDSCSSWDCEFEDKDLISRADAIETVHDWLEEQEYGHNDATEYLATEYLFKTLSELPSAELPNGDLISRTDAIKAVLSLPMPLRLADEIDETLRSLPSADAEPKPYKGGEEE